ncbi:MAG: M3 family oligoendopeptidase [Truepera sp.]|nr:M3 family oligoendopeptidase [Truepera sp.]
MIQTLPHWQLESIFPGLDSPAFREAQERFKRDLTTLEALMDERQIYSQREPSGAEVELFETLLERFNALYTTATDIGAYLYGFISTDAFNDQAQALYSELQPLTSTLSALHKRFLAWLGAQPLETLLAESELARAHAYFLRRSQVMAQHLMSDDAEALASALEPVAGSAWSKLQQDLVSRHTARLSLPGREEAEVTLSELEILQQDESSAVREAAFGAEIALLERNAVSYAAAINSIKGEVNELTRRRGWPSALDEALFDSAISRAALGAMQQACSEQFPVFRRYLKAKARFLGKDTLPWYDLTAPVSVGAPRRYSWDEAQALVLTAFAGYSEKLAAFAQRTFAEGWCDVPPRKGKTNGAFCMDVPGVKESRVLLNFGGTLDDLFTLAHELGHAYHNHCLFEAERTPLQSDTPMTLAETASIFCETIMVNAALAKADETERLAILEQDLHGSTQLVIDIHSRFLFEQGVFDQRHQRELSQNELKQLMQEAQQATYGEALSKHHPLMWARKSHYYSTGQGFYNYPYTFGYLFGLGLYAQYQAKPEGFAERYDHLLSCTGLDDAATLARRFGIDIEDVAFWRGSLSIAAARVADYEKLVARFAP